MQKIGEKWQIILDPSLSLIIGHKSSKTGWVVSQDPIQDGADRSDVRVDVDSISGLYIEYLNTFDL